MSLKPSIPKGTRDFSPSEMAKRNFIFDTIRKIFHLYGFQQIETPAMENLATLEGKYGDEGDKLLFRILNSGPVLEKISEQKTKLSVPDISEKGLRYDLTVPFARYVVQHRNEIVFPFRRYQMQPVWRADRPQKGRYREFFQCDADVIGSTSMINEAEFVQIITDVFLQLKINVRIKLNNRKILAGIAEAIGEKEKVFEFTAALDKIDKIGIEGVNKEFREKGISEGAIMKLQPLLAISGSTEEKISGLKNMFSGSATGRKGIEEVESLFTFLTQTGIQLKNVELDFSLAHGLNYYTGTIFEVSADGVQMGSICGGGRYDDLTGIFGLPDVSGVGISFGIDRIYDVMEELHLFGNGNDSARGSIVMFVNFGPIEESHILPLLAKVRNEGICAEIYPDSSKIKKQFDYANKNGIPFVAVIGDDEMKTATVTLKDMNSGEQVKITVEELLVTLRTKKK